MQDKEKVQDYLLPTNFDLPIKLLFQKPARLLALTAAVKSSETCYLNTEFRAKLDNKYILIFGGKVVLPHQ